MTSPDPMTAPMTAAALLADEPGHGRLVGPRRLVRRLAGPAEPIFSICVMVTDWAEYRVCADSFLSRGFDATCCEYLVVDNSESNRADGYVAVNEFLQGASGRYVILCHQDVILVDDGRAELEREIAKVDAADPFWGVCGNAGHTREGWPVVHLSHPHGERDVKGGPFPRPVMSLDENFLLVRRQANLVVSRDLAGFHHYGVDLCMMAEIIGWTSHVLAFHLHHKSGGTINAGFARSREAIRVKYSRSFRSRWVHTVTRQPFFVSGSALRHPWIVPLAKARLLVAKLLDHAPRGRDLDDPGKLAAEQRRRMRRQD